MCQLTLVQYIVVVVIVKIATDVVNVTDGESMSLNCTISGDGSYTWERQDGIEVENAKRQVTLLSLFSISIYYYFLLFFTLSQRCLKLSKF